MKEIKEESYGRLFWNMFKDERLIVFNPRKNNSQGCYEHLQNDAIILYCRLLNLIGLSKMYDKYQDKKGQPFVCFSYENAEEELQIKKSKFFDYKKQLKELGLIDYKEQKNKKDGESTPIYVIDYNDWSKKNNKKVQNNLETKCLKVNEPQEKSNENQFQYPDGIEEKRRRKK